MVEAWKYRAKERQEEEDDDMDEKKESQCYGFFFPPFNKKS